jgi:hypothetical protein
MFKEDDCKIHRKCKIDLQGFDNIVNVTRFDNIVSRNECD